MRRPHGRHRQLGQRPGLGWRWARPVVALQLRGPSKGQRLFTRTRGSLRSGGSLPGSAGHGGSAASNEDQAGRPPTASVQHPPNDGFLGERTTETLQPGVRGDRYGGPGGNYLAPEGTPFTARSMPAAHEGYPAAPNCFYECLRCGDILPSAPDDATPCKCRNVIIDLGRTSVGDPSVVKYFCLKAE